MDDIRETLKQVSALVSKMVDPVARALETIDQERRTRQRMMIMFFVLLALNIGSNAFNAYVLLIEIQELRAIQQFLPTERAR